MRLESGAQLGPYLIPKTLFPVRVTGLTDTRTHYAVTQDSRRFLINTRNEASAVAPIISVRATTYLAD